MYLQHNTYITAHIFNTQASEVVFTSASASLLFSRLSRRNDCIVKCLVHALQVARTHLVCLPARGKLD